MADERSQDLDRFITFVDAIIAIAMTLLVLPLVDLAGQLDSDGSVSALMREHGDEFLAFVLSFVVIARLWFAQHHLLRDVVELTRPVSYTLVAWTLTIVFLPFPTALLASAGHQTLTKVLYIGTLTVSSLLLSALAQVIGRDPTRTVPGPGVAPTVVSAVLLLTALGITLLVPSASYYPLLLLFGSDAVVNVWRRLTHGGSR